MDQDEVGLSLTAAAELTRRIGLRLTTTGRVGLDVSSGGAGATPFGVTAALSIYALL